MEVLKLIFFKELNIQLDSYQNSLINFKQVNKNSNYLATTTSETSIDENNIDLINQNLFINVSNEINELNK